MPESAYSGFDSATPKTEGLEVVWFDGQSAQAHRVWVAWANGSLLIQGAAGPLRFGREQLDIEEAVGKAPQVIHLPGGARLELPYSDKTKELLKQLGHRDSWIIRLSGNGPAVIVACVALLGLVTWVYLVGFNLISRPIANMVPAEWVEAQRGVMLRSFDETGFLKPSKLSPEQQASIRNEFNEVLSMAGQPEDLPPADWLEWKVEFRSWQYGPNAFALPDGTLVVLDALVDKFGQDTVVAVLAHELGHHANRHGLRQSIRQAMTGAVFALSIGDFSTIFTLLGPALLELSHSRDDEREADYFAAVIWARAGRPIEPLLSLHEELKGDEGSDNLNWLSTHPGSAERIELMRQWYQENLPPRASQ